MAWVLLQVGRLTEIQREVRDHFDEGGSINKILLVLLGLAVVVFTVYCLTKRQRLAAETSRKPDPQRLFSDLLKALELTPTQRHHLEALSRDLQLTQPAVILLSPVLFDRCVAKWQANRRSAAPQAHELSDPDAVAGVRTALFPQP